MSGGEREANQPFQNEEIVVAICAAICVFCCLCAFVSAVFERFNFCRRGGDTQRPPLTNHPRSLLKWCCWFWWCNTPEGNLASHILPISFIDLPPTYDCIAKLPRYEDEPPPSYAAAVAIQRRMTIA
uniref:Uncharacterized protein n=1 Tax=Plectus sambesii TaxID=2011161 RepID=A0A914VIL9_9BILA